MAGLQLAGQPSATPRPNGYLYTTHGRVPALVSPPAARPPDPQPAPPSLSPPSPGAGGSVRGRVAMASQVSLGAARSSHYRSRPFSAAAAPDHRSRGGQAGARRANPRAQAWQWQQPAAVAAAAAASQRRGGGGRAGAARSSSARRRSFPNSPSRRAPRARRASGASFGTPWPWPRAHGRCRWRQGRVGRGRGVQAGGRGGGLLAGGLARVCAHGHAAYTHWALE